MNPKPLPFIVPHKTPFKCKRQRFERKRMTLIAAFSGAPGVVLISDSQETVSGYAKRRVDKIEQRTHPFPYAIAGAGDGIHIEALKFEIAGALTDLSEYSLPLLHETLKRVSLDYFQKYIWPRGADKPSVEMLLTTQKVGSHPDIWQIADGAALWVDNNHRSIGVGSYLAEYLIEKLPSFRQDEAEMIAGAAYILKEVGDHIDGVGLDRVVQLFRRDGTSELFSEETLLKFDPLFLKFNQLISHMFDSAFCMEYPMKPDELLMCRKELREEYEETIQQIINEYTRLGYRANPFRKSS
jgi:hypothetical protein